MHKLNLADLLTVFPGLLAQLTAEVWIGGKGVVG